jgi:predicted RNA binding protein YcfA (HicA-like mRNA interferase family)
MAQHRSRFSPSDIKSDELMRLLTRAGWDARTGRGSHAVLTKPGFANITLPKVLKPNTWSTIERVLGLQIETMINKHPGRHVVDLTEWRRRIELAGQLAHVGFGESFIQKHAGTTALYDHGFRAVMVDELGVEGVVEKYVLPNMAASREVSVAPDPRKPGPVSIKVPPRAPTMRTIPADEAPTPEPHTTRTDTRLHWRYVGNPKTLCGLPTTKGVRVQDAKASEMASALASSADTCSECTIAYHKYDAERMPVEQLPPEEPRTPREIRMAQHADAAARADHQEYEVAWDTAPEPYLPASTPPFAPARDDAVLDLMGDIQSAINELPGLIAGAQEAGTLRAQLAFVRRRMSALRGALHACVTELDAVLNILDNPEPTDGTPMP